MNCQFCNVKKATHRCPSCGTCVCDKHVEKRLGGKIFWSILLLIVTVPIGVWLASYSGIYDEWVPLVIGIFLAYGVSNAIGGEGCMKCHKDLKKL